jgi:hypothetical protein
MATRTTRKMYDPCAANQDARRVTGHFDYVTDLNRFVRQNNACSPDVAFSHQTPLAIVDIDSALSGRDRLASNCDEDMYPHCGSKGCLLPTDPRIKATINPQACVNTLSQDQISSMQTNTWEARPDDNADESHWYALQLASPFSSIIPQNQAYNTGANMQQSQRAPGTCGGYIPAVPARQQGQAQTQDGGQLSDLWRQWASTYGNSDPLVRNYLSQQH